MAETKKILVIGELLFDIFPDHAVPGGAPFNFAFHLKKLGFPVRFVSRIGTDDLGRKLLNFLQTNDFDPDDIQTDPDHDTGTVRVTMSGDSHSFYITPNAAWDHLRFDRSLSDIMDSQPRLIYFGSLVQRTPNGETLIRQMTRRIIGKSAVFCDLNLRPDAYTQKSIKTSLDACSILKLNSEELEKVTSRLNFPDDRPDDRLFYLMRSHDISQIILTMGPEGSIWRTGTKSFFKKAIKSEGFIDSVGAGDGYAAVCAAAFLKGIPAPEAMTVAAEFAGYICSVKGALPSDDTIYQNIKRIFDSI